MTNGQIEARKFSMFLNMSNDKDLEDFTRQMTENEHPVIQKLYTRLLSKWIVEVAKLNENDSRITTSVILGKEILNKINNDKLI